MRMNQTLAQAQTLKMNQRLYQSLKLMELPSLDLREKITEELEKNPALEIIEDKSIIALSDAFSERKSGFKKREKTRLSYSGASDNYRGFIEGALSREETLQEHLLRQLQLEPASEEIKKIAETLIQNLNEDGFNIEDPKSLFKEAPPAALLEEAAKIVQNLEPAGCCSKDYKEALKIQIENLHLDLPEEKERESVICGLIENLDLIQKEKYSILAKKINISEDDIREVCEIIKTLSPFPGRAFSAAEVRYVIPDIKVTKEINEEGETELVINLNDEAFPVLGVSGFYKKLALKGGKDSGLKEAREFARANMREARLFIENLERRNKTLVRVAGAIIRFQREFFLKGPKYLAPLTLKDIAQELKLHEATISRAANGKYMQTEWGIFEIRRFFTNSVSGTGKNTREFSKESVKEIIKEIISGGGDGLSDQEISAILGQKGIALARRTVAKYRKELDMGSSYARRPHGCR